MYDGLLNGEFDCFTLFNVKMVRQFPNPMLMAASDTYVLGHSKPTWDTLHQVIDLCAGFGGLAQGAVAGGFEIALSVD